MRIKYLPVDVWFYSRCYVGTTVSFKSSLIQHFCRIFKQDITIVDVDPLKQKASRTNQSFLRFSTPKTALFKVDNRQTHFDTWFETVLCALGTVHTENGYNRKVWRGHRTTICCQVCFVNVRLWFYSILNKCCWTICHPKNLVVCQTSCFKENDEDKTDEENHPKHGHGIWVPNILLKYCVLGSF